MKAFLEYFLGAGSTQEFAIFTPAHFAPILFTLVMIYLVHRFRNSIGSWKKEHYLRYIMAFIMICAEMSYYWRLVAIPSLGPNPVENLPIGVCTWAVIFCSYMVIGKSQTLFDISYFWLLCGSVFALLTPTPLNYTGPTRFRYYQFWAVHTVPFIGLFYMIFIHKMRPTIRSAVKAYIALFILAVIAYGVNNMIPGANYLFLAKPESAPSVLDILPPNFALRTLIIAAVITLLFALVYLPWYLKDKKNPPATQEAAE